MYLFGWRKRIAFLLCSFLFLGSISYIAGTISKENYYSDDKNNNSFLDKNFFNNSLPLKLFSKAFSIPLPEVKKSLNYLISYSERENVWAHIKQILKSKIVEKLSLLKPQIKFDFKDLKGNIFYRWIDRNLIWVIFKFKLDLFDSKNWFYDNFAVIINKNN